MSKNFFYEGVNFWDNLEKTPGSPSSLAELRDGIQNELANAAKDSDAANAGYEYLCWLEARLGAAIWEEWHAANFQGEEQETLWD